MKSAPRLGFAFLLAWVVANAAGFGALAIADWATGGAVYRTGVHTWELGSPLPSAPVGGLVGGVVIGATVGLMQAFILRWGVSRSALWGLATAVGMPAAFTIGTLASIAASTISPSFLHPFRVLGFLEWWALSLPMGAVIGIVQISALRGRLSRPIRWVLANSVGYATGFVAGVYVGVAWGEHYGYGINATVSVMVGYTLGGGVVGVITGIALMWLLRLSHQLPSERPALSITQSMVHGLGLLRSWPILSVSFLAWLIAENVVLPLTQVEAPNVAATALIVAGLVLLLAMASFVAGTAAARVAPASGMGSGRLPAFMLAVVPVVLLLGLPFYLLSLSMSTSFVHSLLYSLLALGSLVLIAFVCLALRLALAPAAVVLGGTGVHKAFQVSWRLTNEQRGAVLFLGSPAIVLWSAIVFVPVPWLMPWVIIVHGVTGGVASAWMAIVLMLAYVQLAGAPQSVQTGPARSIHKTFIVGMLVFATAGVGLAAGQRALIPSGPGRILFSSGQVYVMNADGSNIVRLTSGPGYAELPRFSPDGRRILFVSTRDNVSQIAIMNADGSNVVRLTNLPKGGEDPAFTMGGSRIAFTSDRDPPGIYLMNPDGSNVTHLVSLPKKGLHPRISADGRRIVFVSNEDGQIYVMNVDGSGVSPLTKLLHRTLPLREAQAEYSAFTLVHGPPAISSDGKEIAFVSMDDLQLYVMNADGSNIIRLTNLPGDGASYPAFSPDGTRIAFTSIQINIINTDGSNATRLTRVGFLTQGQLLPLDVSP